MRKTAPGLSARERFIESKCPVCGKATPAKHNGLDELFVMPACVPQPLGENFPHCAKCGNRTLGEMVRLYLSRFVIDIARRDQILADPHATLQEQYTAQALDAITPDQREALLVFAELHGFLQVKNCPDVLPEEEV